MVARFNYKTFRFVVKYSTERKEFVYRDEAHLGGPWSSAVKAIGNPSFDIQFRKRLKLALEELNER